MTSTENVLDEVLLERERQERKWGEQNHPDGTGPDVLAYTDLLAFMPRARRDNAALAEAARARCDVTHARGRGTYEQILTEEWAEAIACDDPARLREELLQVAAVAVAWIEAIDRRTTQKPPPMTKALLEERRTRDRSGVASIARGVAE